MRFNNNNNLQKCGCVYFAAFCNPYATICSDLQVNVFVREPKPCFFPYPKFLTKHLTKKRKNLYFIRASLMSIHEYSLRLFYSTHPFSGNCWRCYRMFSFRLYPDITIRTIASNYNGGSTIIEKHISEVIPTTKMLALCFNEYMLIISFHSRNNRRFNF